MAIQVTIALNCRELPRIPAHLIILAESQNRTGDRVLNIASQARGPCSNNQNRCSSKVQQPHRTTSTQYDCHQPLACANDLYRLLCP
jgi:hypothetical protein